MQEAVETPHAVCPARRIRHGQALVDYIVILGVVLVLGLATLGILGYWPDLTLSYKNRQSLTFWSEQARPITIPEAYYRMSSQQLDLSFKAQIDEPLELTALRIDNWTLALYRYDSLGNLLLACNQASCQTSACTCNLTLPARVSARARTETFGSGMGCRQAGTQIRLPVRLDYRRPSEPSRIFTQNSTIELVVQCQAG